MPVTLLFNFFLKEANNVEISERTGRCDREPWDDFYRIQVEFSFCVMHYMPFSAHATDCCLICGQRWNGTKQTPPWPLKREAFEFPVDDRITG